MKDKDDRQPCLGEKERLAERSRVGQMIMLGTNVAVGFIVLTLIGYYLDLKYGMGSVLTITGMILGFIFGAYEFWKTIRDIQNSESASKSGKKGCDEVKKE